MDEPEQLNPDGTQKPTQKKYPRDDVPLVRRGFYVLFALVLLWGAIALIPGSGGKTIVAWIIAVIFPFVLVFMCYLLLTVRFLEGRQEPPIAFDSIQVRQELKDDFPNALARLHLRWIGDYYAETKGQARNSFRLTVVASVVSLIVVVAGIGFLYYGKTEVGEVTAASGVIEGIISAVFFSLHTRTVTKMADYHQKLILTQNVSLALKAADDLKEPERTKVKRSVIQALTKDVSKGFMTNRPASRRNRTESSNGVPEVAEHQ